MEPVRVRINSSSRLWAVKTEKFKKNILTMTLILPISRETTPEDALFPAVLLRGTEEYPTNASLSIRCDELYGTILDYNYSYIGDSLMVTLLALFLDDRAVGETDYILDGVIRLLSGVWLRPLLGKDGTLRADEVEKAKTSMCDSIRATINDTAAYASKRCRELMCKDEPYGYSITVDDVMSITPQGLTDRYRYLRDNCGVTFFYVGTRDAGAVASKLERAFDGLTGSLTESIGTGTPAPVSPRCGGETMPVTQGKLSMGFHAGGATLSERDEYYAMLLASEIFGGSPASKLFRNVRERLSLCYYCGSYYNEYKGIIYVSAGIDTCNRERAENEIQRQLSLMRDGDITSDEISAARMSLINFCRQIEDRPNSVWSFCFPRMLLGADCSIDRHISRIDSVTPEQIIDAARSITTGAVYFIGGTSEVMVADGN